MKLIKRNKYFDVIKETIGSPDIKILTGIRRAGKSQLSNDLVGYIKKDKKVNVIYIDFNDLKNEELLQYHKLNNYISEKLQKNKKNVVVIDEVQMCDKFEKVINSLHSKKATDIYITGSNAFLLSSDLATLFTGRSFTIEVFPFSFEEYLIYYKKGILDDYIVRGGLSGSYIYKTQEARFKYIREIFNTLICRDIISKYKIRNKKLLEDITNFMIDNIANIYSGRSMAEAMINQGIKVNDKTIDTYVKYLCDAFLFYRVKRYDIKGKKYLSSNYKYYLCDHSFKYALQGTRNMDFGRTLENIVAIELLRRNYDLYVGILYNTEIDFVAIKGKEKIYIQVAYSIEDQKTIERELKPLKQIKDSYKKILIARTHMPIYDIDGIEIIDVEDWLKGTL